MGKKRKKKLFKKYITVPMPKWLLFLISILIIVISGIMLYLNLTESEFVYEVVDPVDVVGLIDNGAIVIDTNPQEWYNESHIPGAISLPINVSSTCMSCWLGRLMKNVDANDVCIVYDNSMVRSEKAWLYCQEKKTPHKVYIIRGGLLRWKAEEYPIESNL